MLPDVIYSMEQFDLIEQMEARPNFITLENVTGEVVVLEDAESKKGDAGAVDVSGKIVVIQKQTRDMTGYLQKE